jgi:hypothetical protein
MDTAKYILSLLVLVTLPPALLPWFFIHHQTGEVGNSPGSSRRMTPIRTSEQFLIPLNLTDCEASARSPEGTGRLNGCPLCLP